MDTTQLFVQRVDLGSFGVVSLLAAGDTVEIVLKNWSPSTRMSTRHLREEFSSGISKHGWSKAVKVSPNSQITVTSMRKDIALCLQLGNVGRFYADLLKLQTMFVDRIIRGGILVLPTKHEARRIGSNIANTDRGERELAVFKSTITVPLILFGIQR